MRWIGKWWPAVVVVLVVLATGCRYELSQPGVTASCEPLRFAVNEHGLAVGEAAATAVDDAVAAFGALVGRTVVDEGATSATAATHGSGDPLVIEWAWPDDAPSRLGFAEPLVVDGRYREGWMMLRPMAAGAPAGVIRRLVLHELGHLYGLDDVDDPTELMDPDLVVDDWGPGDLTGLLITHDGGCPGNTFADALADHLG